MKTKLKNHRFLQLTLFLLLFLVGFSNPLPAQSPIRVVVAGLNHDHVHGILSRFMKGQIKILGIAEPDQSLHKKYGKLYHIPDSLFFNDLNALVIRTKPDAVLAYNAVAAHVDVVRVCAPLGISVMVEKPLAANLTQALEIERLANANHIRVLVNFETTWYASHLDLYNSIKADSIGAIKKMVAHDGHEGPKEIGCSKEFLAWLTDPVLNGAGALNDFGCYGADLMTWLMGGIKPIAVTAILKHYKPDVYPKVEDDATLIVEYPTSIGMIEGSWNWPFSIKDLEVFGEKGYLHALDANRIVTRLRDNKNSLRKAIPLPSPIQDPIDYLTSVLQKRIPGRGDLSSLEYNMIVMQILDAGKRSSQTGKRIVL